MVDTYREGWGSRGGLNKENLSLECKAWIAPSPSSLSFFFFYSTSKMCQMTGQKPPEVFIVCLCVCVSHKGTGVLRFKLPAMWRGHKGESKQSVRLH